MPLDEALVRDWERALAAVKRLTADDLAADPGAPTVASVGAADLRISSAAAQRFEDYERFSDALSFAVLVKAPGDESRRALATIAAADIDAAREALRLDAELFEPEGGLRPRVAAAAPDASTANEYAADLLTRAPGADLRGSPEWLATLEASLAAVTKESAEGIVDLAASAMVGAVGAQLGVAASGLFDGRLTGILDSVGAGLSWLKQKALGFIRRGLDKVTALFGDKVREAVQRWVNDTVSGLPEQVVSQLAGVKDTVDAWERAAADGADLQSAMGAVKSSEESHLNQLKWAGRAAGVLAAIYPAVQAAAAGGVPLGLIAVALIASGVAGWMFWAAWDHSHDVRRLVAS